MAEYDATSDEIDAAISVSIKFDFTNEGDRQRHYEALRQSGIADSRKFRDISKASLKRNSEVLNLFPND